MDKKKIAYLPVLNFNDPADLCSRSCSDYWYEAQTRPGNVVFRPFAVWCG